MAWCQSKPRPRGKSKSSKSQISDSFKSAGSSSTGKEALKDMARCGKSACWPKVNISVDLIGGVHRATGEGPLTLEDANLQMQEIKRLDDLKAEKEKSEKRIKRVLSLDELRAQAKELSAYEAKRAKMLKEYNHFINFRDDLLPITKFSYRLVATQVGKLGISPPPELIAFDLPLAEKKAGMKRKRRAEAIHELIRIQNAINVNSESAQDMYNKMIYVIEAREDVVEARKIQAIKDSLSAKPKRATSDVFKSETSSRKSKITNVSLCIGKYTVLAVCQIIHCASGLLFLIAVCLIRQRVVIQNVQGQQHRGQGNNARGAGTTGYGGAQNRVGNANPGQASQIKYYNCNGIGHIASNCTQPKRPQNSEYFKDKMLLMQAQENGVALDEEQLLFIAGGQDNVVDEDVDEQLVQDLALNVDNVFQADDCDAFDSDVDEAPTTQTMFMANLSSPDPICDEAGPSYDSDILSEVHDHDHFQDAVCEHHEVHEIHDDVQPNYVVDSHAD
ncbi:retrovirus-related pol polyprotein from transposon TNT 1-94, partial [Tanacetum coccineum]